ncbi:MAG TPA: (2Fe-2S)-binding protein [Pyrinomonadaceae bacterium]|nr:(2Fe-2S)-binding protein [Pyrinomonadaceae bacterium]
MKKDDVKELSNSAGETSDGTRRTFGGEAEARAVADEGGKVSVRCTVNGEAVTLRGYPLARLLDVLREELKLTGTKEGCGEGECGACSVIIGGELVNSCLVPVAQAEGAEIRTIEGVADGERLHAVQRAMIECGGAQCGICTPGMVLAAVNLLEREPRPTEADIREGLAGNLCRCTGYMKIFEAVVRAVESKDEG